MRRRRIHIILSALTLLAGSGSGRVLAGSDPDVPRLRAQFVEWHTRDVADADTVEAYMRTLGRDGSWPNVDYASTERGGWPTYSHPARTLAMAEAYRKPGHPLAGDAKLRAAIVRSLEHWTDNDYINPNWWYPRIGVPRTVAPILILMDDGLPAELRQKTVQTVLGRSKMGMTGQNKVWLAGIAFMKGLLASDAALMTKARDQIFSELRVTTQEGIQPDYSFHQHGPQQQWGNYGASFGSDMIRWARILRGTRYALEPERFDVIRRYLLEGSAWILWEGQMDISGCGRQIFRNCQSGKGRGILGQLGLMASFDPCEPDRYRSLIASNQPDGVNALVGHKHFWRSDITVHRRPSWYASVKMSSTRVIGAETCNSENMLGLHLGDGVTYFYRTGGEYENLFPVWDWRRLPGTTCRRDEGSLVPNSRACRGRSDFVGGVTDGTCGVAAMEYIRDGLRARKAWFFLDDTVVCLGSGIDCDQPESVVTCLNQCALAGPVVVSADRNPRELPRGEHAFRQLDWAHHDGIGYVLLEPASVGLRAGPQEGNWHAVHHRESKREVERDVLGLWIEHGTKPHDAGYAYAVLPDVPASAMPSLTDSLPFTVLGHTSSVQALSARDGSLVLAVFFEPGRLTWAQGPFVEVDTPCLVMRDATPDGIRLRVSDPTQKHDQIVLRLPGRYAGQGTRYNGTAGKTEVTVDLPSAGRAGKTTSLVLRRRESP